MTDARAFHGFRFPAGVILRAVRWCLRFPVIYRDLEREPADRGVEVDHVTLFRWVRQGAFKPRAKARQAPVGGILAT